MWMQTYSSLPVSNSRIWWYDTSFLCINLPSYFRWLSMCVPPHLEWIEGAQTPQWNETSGAVLFPGFRACAGIQVPIIFTSNVNQRTRTRQSPLLPFGMEMGCIHRNAAILAADEMGWLGLIKISPQIQALWGKKLKSSELQTGPSIMSRKCGDVKITFYYWLWTIRGFIFDTWRHSLFWIWLLS